MRSIARHILKLEALEPLAAEPGAAERGTLIHDVLGRFAGEHPVALPALAAERLLQLGEDAFGDLADSYPELHAEWWRRFERLAQAYIVWEAERRAGLKTIFAERSGALVLPLADGTRFTLRGRADRIEDRGGGDFAIVDFKTGQPPSAKEVCVGFSPQLTLEAAMLMEGVFKDVAAASQMPEILYVQVSGGRTPLREKRIVPKDGRTIDEVIADHWRAFAGMIAAYAAGERAYVSRPYPKYARRFSAYDHLARVKEWSLANADEEGEP